MAHLLVVVDGRQSRYSVGMTTFEMAQTLVGSGLSPEWVSTAAGPRPSRSRARSSTAPPPGSERAISTALMLQYFGVYIPPPARPWSRPTGTARPRSSGSRSRWSDRRR
jgi:hypothetical protein